ncbi:UNKNOWN [Stylonychia lemnae]|uniref:CDP-alcohol phosphatidyltransferase n=1 Tax=Stylonychia lemnae TaxID=5949 RepID=A0A078AMN7_STYLE|nr:UNKNOWN [Stylonychia lemnae]|eukprot:CDW83660.1 UNKNOWN [Stylonychia lemnae]
MYGQNFEGEVPAWWCYFEAVSYLIYRMLDEMDGKQARKTGNSSPLGLLFDHGCDSFTTGLMTMMLMKLLQVGNSHMLILGLVAITQAFHFSTLEEYYVGGLFLGVGNGVTDGSIVLIGVVTLCGVFGQSFWKEIFSITVFEETSCKQVIYLFLLIMFQYIYNGQTSVQRPNSGIKRDDAIIYWNPIVPCLIGVFLYVHITVHIQVAHVSKQKYNPWPRLMLSSFFIMVIYTVLCKYQRYEINQQYYFMSLLIFISICQWHFILNVIYEMTVTLNIRVFKVKPVQILINQILSLEKSTISIPASPRRSGQLLDRDARHRKARF